LIGSNQLPFDHKFWSANLGNAVQLYGGSHGVSVA